MKKKRFQRRDTHNRKRQNSDIQEGKKIAKQIGREIERTKKWKAGERCFKTVCT